MNVSTIIKRVIDEKNPFVRLRRNKMRKSLKNTDVTFLCPNCIGGILFHDLGIQFKSPTVNLMMTQVDFIKFILNMDYYLEQNFVFYDDSNYSCPCAKLDDIVVHFTHYADENIAVEKWSSRVLRMNKDNIFVFLTERDGITKEQIAMLRRLNVRGLVVFTSNNYPDIEYAVHIPKYEQQGEVGNILKKSIVNGKREYERYFDFVKWFNESTGESYDVTPFKQ